MELDGERLEQWDATSRTTTTHSEPTQGRKDGTAVQCSPSRPSPAGQQPAASPSAGSSPSPSGNQIEGHAATMYRDGARAPHTKPRPRRDQVETRRKEGQTARRRRAQRKQTAAARRKDASKQGRTEARARAATTHDQPPATAPAHSATTARPGCSGDSSRKMGRDQRKRKEKEAKRKKGKDIYIYCVLIWYVILFSQRRQAATQTTEQRSTRP